MIDRIVAIAEKLERGGFIRDADHLDNLLEALAENGEGESTGGAISPEGNPSGETSGMDQGASSLLNMVIDKLQREGMSYDDILDPKNENVVRSAMQAMVAETDSQAG